jgi:hypothetical protein
VVRIGRHEKGNTRAEKVENLGQLFSRIRQKIERL